MTKSIAIQAITQMLEKKVGLTAQEANYFIYGCCPGKTQESMDAKLAEFGYNKWLDDETFWNKLGFTGQYVQDAFDGI